MRISLCCLLVTLLWSSNNGGVDGFSPTVGVSSSLSSLSIPSKSTTPFTTTITGTSSSTQQNAIADLISSNEDLLPGITAINEMNDKLYTKLIPLRERPYFRLYSVDILASCEYMPQELFECYSETCEVYPVDEEEVPLEIIAADAKEFDFKIDGWARWDMPRVEDYYDTSMFPEDYTGYDGSEIWDFIHNRICFEGYGYNDDHWKADFNKAFSGLHSMVSAQIIMGIQDKIDSGEEFTEDEKKWGNPTEEFQRRLSPSGETPLALENLYFGFMLLLKAVSKSRCILLDDCEKGKIDPEAAAILRDILSNDELLALAKRSDKIGLTDPKECQIGIAYKRLHDHAVQEGAGEGQSSLWEARMRCRELLRVMNCVQCNKCRFHGKIAVMGLSTAFKILLGNDGEGMVQNDKLNDNEEIHRVELATMMTCLYKFSRTINFCKEQLALQEQRQ